MSIHILSKTLLTIILLAAGLTAGAQTNSRIKQLQKQSTTLKKQIADSEKLLRSTKKDVSSQLNNLAILNGQIDEQQKIVTGYEEEAAGLARDINGLEKQIATLTAELAACKHKYRRAVLYMNRNRLMQNKWGFILMSENFRQMYRRMRYAANYSKYLKVQGEAIRKKKQPCGQNSNSLPQPNATKTWHWPTHASSKPPSKDKRNSGKRLSTNSTRDKNSSTAP